MKRMHKRCKTHFMLRDAGIECLGMRVQLNDRGAGVDQPAQHRNARRFGHRILATFFAHLCLTRCSRPHGKSCMLPPWQVCMGKWGLAGLREAGPLGEACGGVVHAAPMARSLY